MGRHSVAGMPKLARSIVSMLARRFRSRAVVETREPRAPSPAARSLSPAAGSAPAVRDRPLALGLALPIVAALSGGNAVGQAGNVIQWHRQGFRLFWRWRSRLGRPSVEREIRDLSRQMSSA